MEKNINNEIDAIKKVYKQSDVVEKNRSTRLKHQILSVDGNTDRAFINNFVDNEFLSIDVLEFRRYVNSISPDLQLQVEVEDGVLTISGDKHSAFENEGATVLRRELKQSSFCRKFELGELLDGENISANFKDGILSVSVPKVEPEKPKKHTVKIA